MFACACCLYFPLILLLKHTMFVKSHLEIFFIIYFNVIYSHYKILKVNLSTRTRILPHVASKLGITVVPVLLL